MATQAQTPRGVNHVVLNVRNLDVSHRFWTEIMGFKCVAELKPIPGRPRPKMRFYSGVDAKGDVTHHDLALAEVPADAPADERGTWSLMPARVAGVSPLRSGLEVAVFAAAAGLLSFGLGRFASLLLGIPL